MIIQCLVQLDFTRQSIRLGTMGQGSNIEIVYIFISKLLAIYYYIET